MLNFSVTFFKNKQTINFTCKLKNMKNKTKKLVCKFYVFFNIGSWKLESKAHTDISDSMTTTY